MVFGELEPFFFVSFLLRNFRDGWFDTQLKKRSFFELKHPKVTFTSNFSIGKNMMESYSLSSFSSMDKSFTCRGITRRLGLDTGYVYGPHLNTWTQTSRLYVNEVFIVVNDILDALDAFYVTDFSFAISLMHLTCEKFFSFLLHTLEYYYGNAIYVDRKRDFLCEMLAQKRKDETFKNMHHDIVEFHTRMSKQDNSIQDMLNCAESLYLKVMCLLVCFVRISDRMPDFQAFERSDPSFVADFDIFYKKISSVCNSKYEIVHLVSWPMEEKFFLWSKYLFSNAARVQLESILKSDECNHVLACLAASSYKLRQMFMLLSANLNIAGMKEEEVSARDWIDDFGIGAAYLRKAPIKAKHSVFSKLKRIDASDVLSLNALSDTLSIVYAIGGYV